MEASLPIQNIDQVDLVAKRRDGGVDLFIIPNAPLDGSAETQQLLLDKIASYLEQLNTEAFQTEFGHPAPELIKIVVLCTVPPDPVIIELVERAVPWVIENNARLEVRVRE